MQEMYEENNFAKRNATKEAITLLNAIKFIIYFSCILNNGSMVYSVVTCGLILADNYVLLILKLVK